MILLLLQRAGGDITMDQHQDQVMLICCMCKCVFKNISKFSWILKLRGLWKPNMSTTFYEHLFVPSILIDIFLNFSPI